MPIRLTVALAAACLLTLPLSAQTAPTASSSPTAATVPQLDVISVKPNHSSDGSTQFNITDDGMNMSGATVYFLLNEAYQVNRDQIVGAPAWTHSDRFDVQAKVAGPDVAALKKLSFDQRRSMYQQVLTDRFHLVVHRETRELPVYYLVVDKGGTKLKPVAQPASASKGGGYFYVSRNRMQFDAAPMERFLRFLASTVGHTVLDKTGLTGFYNFDLHWTPDDSASAPSSASPDSGPSIFTALQEQLGLKLESGRGPVSVLVIDHIEQPTQN